MSIVVGILNISVSTSGVEQNGKGGLGYKTHKMNALFFTRDVHITYKFIQKKGRR
jgi:hypothetical protein